MAFEVIHTGYPDGHYLLKPSLTLNSEDLILSSTVTTPSDDRWIVTKPKWITTIPYFTILITLSEILSHLLLTGFLYNLFVFDPCKSFEIWRYFTYMFLHSDVCHLIMNIAMQFVVGMPIEYYQGTKRTAVIYITGIVFGTLGAFIFQSGTKVIGASAGTYALLWSHCADAYLNRNRKYILIQIITVFLMIGIDFLYISLHLYKDGNECPKIGWSAHYAGALNGFFLGFILFNGNAVLNNYMRALCLTSWILLLMTILILNFLKIHF